VELISKDPSCQEPPGNCLPLPQNSSAAPQGAPFPRASRVGRQNRAWYGVDDRFRDRSPVAVDRSRPAHTAKEYRWITESR